MATERKRGLYAALRNPKLYETVQRVMGGDERRRHFAEEFVRAQPGDRVLDIGCGPAQLRAYLPEDVEYIGWEPNAAYVEKARTIYGDRGTFNVGLFGPAEAQSLDPVDIAIVSAVLHHMDDAQVTELFQLLRQVLKPGGRVITLDNVFVERQNPIARFLISLDRGRNVRSPDGYKALAKGEFSTVRGVVVPQGFPPYTYFYMTAE